MYGTLISSVTVGSGGAASIDFTSIPGTYTDLVVVASLRFTSGTGGYDDFNLTLNGATSGYSWRGLTGNGSAVSSAANASAQFINSTNTIPDNAATASTFSNHFVYISNYAGSTNKTISVDGVGERNAAAAYQVITAGLYSSTSAVTSLSLKGFWNLAQYSTAYLYGLTKGSGGASVA